MNCTSCETALPLRARFCPACGVHVTLPEDPAFDEAALQAAGWGDELNQRTAPAPLDRETLKARLIDCYVNFSMARELSGWLQALGLPSTGTMQEKLTRVRQQADSLVLPAESLPRQTIWYLNRYDEKILTEICEELGIDNSGPKEGQITRIYYAVGLRSIIKAMGAPSWPSSFPAYSKRRIGICFNMNSMPEPGNPFDDTTPVPSGL